MTGPEHYREAERLLEQADIDSRDPMRKYAEDANLIAAAQVHATLAHAAAVIDQHRSPDSKVAAAWDEVTR